MLLGYTHRDHGGTSEVSSARSTRTSRLRENNASNLSNRSQLHTSDETTSRTTSSARRLREERTSTPTERTTTRSERTTRSSHISEGSPTRSTRTTRSARQTVDTTVESSTDRIKARREARRKRNQEHDDKQNKITVENGEVDLRTKHDKQGPHRTPRDRTVTDDKESQIDKDDKVDSSKVIEKNEDKMDFLAKKDTEDILAGSNEDTPSKPSDSSEKESKIQEDVTDEISTEGSQEITKNDLKEDIIEKLDEHAAIEIDVVADADNAEVGLEVNEASLEDARSGDKHEEVERSRSVENDGKQDSEKEADEIKQVIELETELKSGESMVDEPSKGNEEISKTVEDDVEIVMDATASDELQKTEEKSEILEVSTSEDKQTPDVAAPEEGRGVSGELVERALEMSPLESILVEIPTTNAVEELTVNETSASDKELVLLEELPEMSVMLEGDINSDAPCNETRIKESENEPGNEEPKSANKEDADSLVSATGDVPEGSKQEPDEETVEQKIASPHTSPKKTKVSTKSGEADRKVGKSRTKSNVSRTKSDESQTNTDRLRAKSDVSRTKSADAETKAYENEKNENESCDITTTKSAKSEEKDSEVGAKATKAGAKTSRAGKLKVGDDAWKKNVRKKRGVDYVDRAVELTVLGRTGKIKNKMKSCEARDVETAEQWKREVKTGPRKHKSFDEETEKELRELSTKRELKNAVQACEEKDKESADAWKREVRTIKILWHLTRGRLNSEG